jgi:prepilin-type N-terminal cleavage/methylation domain-containing protein
MRYADAHAARPDAPRRGVTLVEMLVVVALLVLVMTILVAIFQSATGAISVSRTFTAMDQNLRRLDAVIRSDLGGATARFTPPLNPNNNLGYFEYGENALSDLQDEDTDDYLAFTAKAPPGQPFTGRICVPRPTTVYPAASFPNGYQQITVTSDFAEIIYFLRNGNLYRRVLLILPPSWQGALNFGANPGGGLMSPQYTGTNLLYSWQGMNDVSAHPSLAAGGSAAYTPILNTLGDLTNREKRFARPRFANDYVDNTTGAAAPDGQADDQNTNGVPDYYPTLYFGALSATIATDVAPYNNLLFEVAPPRPNASVDTMAFPYVFRGAYSVGDRATPQISVHGLAPNGTVVGTTPAAPAAPPFPYRPNHAPLIQGDNLAIPSATQLQTWWGFPTKREMMAAAWTDPIKRINDPAGAPYFATLGTPASAGGRDVAFGQAPGLSWQPALLAPLPKMNGTIVPSDNQPFNDGAGSTAVVGAGSTVFVPVPSPGNPEAVYQDDLILTGVRSFDVKAYDNSPRMFDPTLGAYINPGPGYYDLGYDDKDNRVAPASTSVFPPDKISFNHEGRVPPATTDFVFDAKYPINPVNNNRRNLGDDRTTVIRLRRVYDTWSTDYTNAPDVPFIPTDGPPNNPPVYPSYPPPYPIPLRGIQVQIRVTDPKNERVKTLTIRQDFTDKL